MGDDLASLDSIESDTVLKTLEKRFDDEKIYTRNGTVLIAINPYEPVGDLYTQANVEKYKAAMSLARTKT